MLVDLSNYTGRLSIQEINYLHKFCHELQDLNQAEINLANVMDRDMYIKDRVFGVRFYSTPETTTEDEADQDKAFHVWMVANQMELRLLRALYEMSAHMANTLGIIPPPPPPEGS